MRLYDCGSLPVVDDDGRLIGILTDRDITVRLVARGVNGRNARVADCMTDGVFACHPNDQIEDCLRTMSRHMVRRLPIVQEDGRVIGILSQSDLLRHAGSHPGQGELRIVADTLCDISEPTMTSHR